MIATRLAEALKETQIELRHMANRGDEISSVVKKEKGKRRVQREREFKPSQSPVQFQQISKE